MRTCAIEMGLIKMQVLMIVLTRPGLIYDAMPRLSPNHTSIHPSIHCHPFIRSFYCSEKVTLLDGVRSAATRKEIRMFMFVIIPKIIRMSAHLKHILVRVLNYSALTLTQVDLGRLDISTDFYLTSPDAMLAVLPLSSPCLAHYLSSLYLLFLNISPLSRFSARLSLSFSQD